MMLKLLSNIKFLYFIFLLPFGEKVSGQELLVLHSFKAYRLLTETDSFQRMIELKPLIPALMYDLRYATKQNFTHQKLYPNDTKTFLRLEAANALRKVEEELAVMGLGLKIWDAYRPYDITKKMWELIGDERYVANPLKGSGHNRGLAVDVTLINLFTGTELSMGTGFDNFTDSAHQSFAALPDSILASRRLLKTTMEKAGFVALSTEWWHYSFPNTRNYQILNLPFRKLAKYRR